MEVISDWASGMGQEWFNIGILSLAVVMLAWHNIWMAVHGKEMAAQAASAARAVLDGTRERSIIFMVVALAVLREGSETVLFLYSTATSEQGGMQMTLLGGGAGLVAGVLVGALLYGGLLRVPLRWFFAVTGILVLLLAASMASQIARFLIQADVLPSWGMPVWDTSGVLAQSSALGSILHGLVGYDPQPTGMQLVFYLTTIAVIYGGMRLAVPKAVVRPVSAAPIRRV
jgi:high-affinity iron transporter